MPAKAKHHPVPFSLQLSQVERDNLSRLAGSQPFAAYIRKKLFEDDHGASHTTYHFNKKSVGKTLGNTGRSEIAENLRRLANAAHSGALPMTPETEQAITKARAAVQDMRRHLLIALGLRPK